MPVTMEQVIAQLGKEEPDYEHAAKLGPEALPHLRQLIDGQNVRLAARAASLAGFIDDPQSVAVIEQAARHPASSVRVAAAAALQGIQQLPSALTLSLLNDDQVGVRKWTLRSLDARPALPASLADGSTDPVRAKVQELAQHDPDSALRQLAARIASRV
jgi:HEAT repeat protein